MNRAPSPIVAKYDAAWKRAQSERERGDRYALALFAFRRIGDRAPSWQHRVDATWRAMTPFERAKVVNASK